MADASCLRCEAPSKLIDLFTKSICRSPILIRSPSIAAQLETCIAQATRVLDEIAKVNNAVANALVPDKRGLRRKARFDSTDLELVWSTAA